MKRSVIKIMLVLICAVIVFHICVIAKLIPYDIAWGGRIENDSQMYVFETLSIAINLLLGLILLMKGNYIKRRFGEKTINIVLWIFLVIFILNTLGNIFAKTNFERFFAILTGLFAVLIWLLLQKKKSSAAV